MDGGRSHGRAAPDWRTGRRGRRPCRPPEDVSPRRQGRRRPRPGAAARPVAPPDPKRSTRREPAGTEDRRTRRPDDVDVVGEVQGLVHGTQGAGRGERRAPVFTRKMETSAPSRDGAFPDAAVGKSLIRVHSRPGPALRPVHRHVDDCLQSSAAISPGQHSVRGQPDRVAKRHRASLLVRTTGRVDPGSHTRTACVVGGR
jgi:hypothetical protein